MLSHAAEESFRRGKAAIEKLRMVEALALFEAAIQLARRHGKEMVQPRYLSYYGLCLAIVLKKPHEGVALCRKAIGEATFDADMYCNLGYALLAAERRRDAHDAFRAGLRIDAQHVMIHRALDGMGRRRRPALPFLARGNPINVMIGKLEQPKQQRKPA